MSFLAEIGIVLAAAACGAFLAQRFRQPVVVWYILLGVLLGPGVLGLVRSDAVLDAFSEIGLVLLLFFVGLEFSLARLRRVARIAAVIAVADVLLNLFAGYVLGTWLGWPPLDALLLAGIIAISSASVAAKTLAERGRLATREGEVLLGVLVVGDLLAILFIVGLVAVSEAHGSPLSVAREVGGAGLAYAAFLLVAVLGAKRVARLLERVHTDQLLIPLALGLVFLSAFVAESLGLPAMTGAFFMGLTFSDTRTAARLADRVALFRDTFVAVFFMGFGALIDPRSFPQAADLLLYAVPLVLVNEFLLVSAFAYLAGLPGRVAASVGAGLTARGEEAVMFASLGARLPGVTHASLLSPFAGLFCLVLSTVMPFLHRRAHALASLAHAVVPGFLRAAAAAVNATARAVLLPSPWKASAGARPRAHGSPRAGLALLRDAALFLGAALLAFATRGLAHVVFTGAAFAALLAFLRSLHAYFRQAAVAFAGDWSSPLGRALARGAAARSAALLPNLVTAAFGGLAAAIFLVAAVWPYDWALAPWALPAYVGFLAAALTYYSLRMRLAVPREPREVVLANRVGGHMVARRRIEFMPTGARR